MNCQNLSHLSVSVIMPTYNEAGNIKELIFETSKALKGSGVENFEILVADDNSPDKTWELAESAKETVPEVTVIRRMSNRGLTNSINEGINKASKDIVVWMDCDFSHPPEKIPQMLYMIDQGFEVVVNSRYVVGGGESRVGKGGHLQRLLSNFLNMGTRLVLVHSFADYTSGFIAARRELFEKVSLRGDYGEYFVDLIFRLLKSNTKICELPYWCEPRNAGESKTGNCLKDYLIKGRKYIQTVITLRIAHLFKKL